MQVVMWTLCASAEDLEPTPEPVPDQPPDEAEIPPAWHQHSLSGCVGNRCGVLGAMYVFRPTEVVSFAVGAGLYGAGVAARLHPAAGARSVFLSGGLSPVFAGDDPLYGRFVFYGADFQAGGEWRAERFFISGSGGLGLAPLPLSGLQAAFALDVAIGVNLVRGK